jgi:hypothetical protein
MLVCLLAQLNRVNRFTPNRNPGSTEEAASTRPLQMKLRRDWQHPGAQLGKPGRDASTHNSVFAGMIHSVKANQKTGLSFIAYSKLYLGIRIPTWGRFVSGAMLECNRRNASLHG